jgi:hypothetical protein
MFQQFFPADMVDAAACDQLVDPHTLQVKLLRETGYISKRDGRFAWEWYIQTVSLFIHNRIYMIFFILNSHPMIFLEIMALKVVYSSVNYPNPNFIITPVLLSL